MSAIDWFLVELVDYSIVFILVLKSDSLGLKTKPEIIVLLKELYSLFSVPLSLALNILSPKILLAKFSIPSSPDNIFSHILKFVIFS